MKRACNHLAKLLVLVALFTATSTLAQNSTQKHLPIIDVHVHAMKVNPAFASDMCPWFLSNMPGADPSDPRPSFMNTDCANPLRAAKSDQEFQDSLVATMKRLNMTIVVSGDGSVIPQMAKSGSSWSRNSKHRDKFIKGHDRGGFYRFAYEGIL
jgi:hypothetical protein